MNSNTKGNIALGQAIAYFTKEEYTISLPLNDCQWYDLIIEKDNIFQTVQVKYTSQKANSGNYICGLETITPSTGKTLYSIVDKPCDFLYIYCENNDSYLIPIKEIPTKTQITLYKQKTSSKVTKLDTSKFLLNKQNIIIESIPIYSNQIKRVRQYDLEGNFIAEYANCSEAARAVGNESGVSHIRDVCKGKRKTAYSFQWRYA